MKLRMRIDYLVFLVIAIVLLSATALGVVRNTEQPQPIKIQAVDYAVFHGPPKYERLVEFNGNVEHLFFHPLIAFPELAFDGDYQAQGLDDYFCTIDEFKRLLESLYAKDFILVDLNLAFSTDPQGKVTRPKLMLPEGKKPIGLSIDDVNYYEYMIKHGMVHKLVLNDKGDVVTYSERPDGTVLYSDDNEIIPILDKFVEDHPDFSHNGAKGTLALTGFAGILGYRTQSDSPNRFQEIEAVRPVVQRLLETGWNFASHSYTHADMAKLSYAKFQEDTLKWHDELVPLIGETQIYVYPYGSGLSQKDPKFSLLVEQGFKMMCHVGSSSYYDFSDSRAAVMDRRHFDGIALRNQRHLNLDLYDANLILDPIRDVLGRAQ